MTQQERQAGMVTIPTSGSAAVPIEQVEPWSANWLAAQALLDEQGLSSAMPAEQDGHVAARDLVLAAVGGRLVRGVAVMGVYPWIDPVRRRPVPVARLDALAVDEDDERQSVRTALLEAARVKAAAIGCVRLDLTSEPPQP